MVTTLVSCSSRLGHTIKTSFINKFYVSLLLQIYDSFWFFRKGSKTSLLTTFCVWIFKKTISQFHCLFAFTSSDIGQCMKLTWSSCFLSSCFSTQPVDRKNKRKIITWGSLRQKKAKRKVKIRKHGIIVLQWFLIVWHRNSSSEKYKQPPEVFCKKRYSLKFCKIHRKTPVPEFLF